MAVQAAEDRWQQQEAQLRGEVALLEESVRRLEGANADLQTASSEHLQPLQRCALRMLLSQVQDVIHVGSAQRSAVFCGIGSSAQPPAQLLVRVQCGCVQLLMLVAWCPADCQNSLPTVWQSAWQHASRAC